MHGSGIKNLLLVILVFALNRYVDSYSSKKQSCTSPDEQIGECMRLGECKTMVDYLNSAPKPIPPEIASKLQAFVCSYQQGSINTQICCPPKPINIPLGDDIIAIPPSPPDITGHKNLELLPENCGLIGLGNKIRNGKDALLKEFPWMALLSYKKYDDELTFECGGTIINERYILTAAHCVVGTIYPLVGVRVGEYNLATEMDCDIADPEDCLPPVQNLVIEDKIPHPNYNDTLFANDIALIRVSKINLGVANAQPICLPISEELLHQQYENGTVTGWGFIDPSGNTTDILQKISLPKQNLNTCIQAYKHRPQIKLSYKQICVGGTEEKDSCRGDSGGPFQVPSYFRDEERYIQHGVVSIGPFYCGTVGFPAIYTKLIYYTKWILDNIEP